MLPLNFPLVFPAQFKQWFRHHFIHLIERWTMRPEKIPNSFTCSVLQIKAQGKSIHAIAWAVKVSTFFVLKTCKDSGLQTLKIPICTN